MGMVRRNVKQILEEHRTEFNGVPMYELKLLIDDGDKEGSVDVILMGEDYNMIKEKGYYYC